MTGMTGALGGRWRAEVTEWGAVVPQDGSPVLDWAVAADDRWHRPRDEPTVRQRRPGGLPVFETRVRIPNGDAVQRVWSAADAGGLTLVEVANDSPLPIAVAFTRPDLLTNRPPADVGVQGIDLPAGSIVVPVGHRTSVTVALAHDGRGAGPLPTGVPAPDAVARGWQALVAKAGRLELPEERLGEAVVAARCDVLLAGPPAADDDPVEVLVAAAELCRLGELDRAGVEAWTPHVAAAVEAIARRDGWGVDAALDAAAVVFATAADRRALGDLVRLRGRRPPGDKPPGLDDPAAGVLAIPAVERRLLRDGALFPEGIPASWRGAALEAHGLVAGATSRLSFAVRWHGEHPAVLWQVVGDPVRLTAPAVDPSWATTDAAGEALWRLSRSPSALT
jgi:hypothetical protein